MSVSFEREGMQRGEYSGVWLTRKTCLSLLPFSCPIMFIFYGLKSLKYKCMVWAHSLVFWGNCCLPVSLGVLASSSWWDNLSVVSYFPSLPQLMLGGRHAQVLLTFSLLLGKNHNLFVYPGFCVIFLLGQQSSTTFCPVEEEVPKVSCNSSSGYEGSPGIRVWFSVMVWI